MSNFYPALRASADRDITILSFVTQACILKGNVTAAYVYARMCARFAEDMRGIGVVNPKVNPKPTIDSDGAYRLRAITELLQSASGKSEDHSAREATIWLTGHKLT